MQVALLEKRHQHRALSGPLCTELERQMRHVRRCDETKERRVVRGQLKQIGKTDRPLLPAPRDSPVIRPLLADRGQQNSALNEPSRLAQDLKVPPHRIPGRVVRELRPGQHQRRRRAAVPVPRHQIHPAQTRRAAEHILHALHVREPAPQHQRLERASGTPRAREPPQLRRTAPAAPVHLDPRPAVRVRREQARERRGDGVPVCPAHEAQAAHGARPREVRREDGDVVRGVRGDEQRCPEAAVACGSGAPHPADTDDSGEEVGRGVLPRRRRRRKPSPQLDLRGKVEDGDQDLGGKALDGTGLGVRLLGSPHDDGVGDMDVERRDDHAIP
ncbi:unnamed protein product [Mycena citricolor]|uniref:Uncharacterized protein n=1 Tax=Mycena citricolor TaxID=2018698 RepID=A0AAD2H4T8_9AGAR|nr:unnamed protein product [Mycena citricolor]